MGKILIIDDDTVTLELCQTLLKVEGFKVVTATKCWEGFTWLDGKTAIDLLILDINMPEFNGFELLDSIRALGVYKGPILMISGRNEREDILKAAELGARDYILKPIDHDVFLRKVRSLLSR